MIQFEKFQLQNGLTVLVNEDDSTPLVAMNILYKVGARDEESDKTGFAHLFEHLMFGGSINIPNYDEPLQIAGAENNAFTNNDFTNYYITIPSQNIETAFWLESDRMLSLAFSEKSLEVQRQVVIEEFKQRYLNQPYGDVWLLLRPLAYKVHPYQWATIGKDVSHIEKASLNDVKTFFRKYYAPDNAIMALSGNINVERARQLCEKWFADIPSANVAKKLILEEPKQNEARELRIEKKVPSNRIYKAYHCCARNDADFYATDLISDILSRGKSSRLHQHLVKEKKLFTDVSAYLLGDLDKSLIVFEGRMVNNVDFSSAEKAIAEEINEISSHAVKESELLKVKQNIESAQQFSEMNIANRALNLCYYEMLGDAADANEQVRLYQKVSEQEILKTARQIFRNENCSTLHYVSQN